MFCQIVPLSPAGLVGSVGLPMALGHSQEVVQARGQAQSQVQERVLEQVQSQAQALVQERVLVQGRA